MKTTFPQGRKGVLFAFAVTASGASLYAAHAAAADPAKLGGETTVQAEHAGAYSLNSANMSARRKGNFLIGNDFFEDPWVIAPATTDLRDGLGPVFNVSACQSCHFNDGRGHAPNALGTGSVQDDVDSLLVRLSRPAISQAEQEKLQQPQVGNLGEPVYGGQLQDRGIPGVAPEVRIGVTYTDVPVRFSDGFEITLRKPQWHFSQWGYGVPQDTTTFSVRVAPPVIGLGLLQAIPEESVLAMADPEDSNGDGISGRPNQVWHVASSKSTLGRFGWKAGQPTVKQQTAGAFNGDMGLTTSLFKQDSCTESQPDCRKAANGNDENGIEVRDDILDFVAFYASNLAVPARRNMNDPQVQQGEKLFQQAGCQSCHAGPYVTPKLDKDQIEQSEQTIYPYTDLLLHDMGSALADFKRDNQPAPANEPVEFAATANEWRTPPLWGIGLAQVVNANATFLHDGRARTPMEAVLWHGGEAQQAKDKVLTFNVQERAALEAFLLSL
ncbi:thiol oxidoreductase [Hahella sp. CCB-MM4]|uniref:di-heme oxidoreductase family protein n=1 Tax=Hahella sp. (strain CCB-MM4) TaxID=1926491 RepID=UPI000B9A97B2|nr:di-heme oxidoredictase family protein [Hahella sp. CCB-MM4]OZG74687.1 thiol oxidoreductase [Hahella sp. CCB-MM4]